MHTDFGKNLRSLCDSSSKSNVSKTLTLMDIHDMFLPNKLIACKNTMHVTNEKSQTTMNFIMKLKY